MSPSLRLHINGEPSREIQLLGEVYRLGRDPDAEIVIQHPAISKRHALLERRHGHWQLRDQGSTNGLSWKGRSVQLLALRDGDRIRLGPEADPSLPVLEFLEPSSRRQWLPWRKALSSGLLSLAGAGLMVLGFGAVSVPVRGSLAPVRGPLVLYDRSGTPINSGFDTNHREKERVADFAPSLRAALLSSEDTRFWWHPGVDPIGITRALLVNIAGGQVLEGGSTLTQQLARSLYPNEVGEGDTLQRKWNELLVALQLEARFSKQTLLLSYLNRVYLGVGWGFEDAAQAYFNHSASALTLPQAALLVGLLPSPNGHDPCRYPEAALAARNGVLNKMVREGRLSADQGRIARRTPIQLAPEACTGVARRPAPFYSDQVERDLQKLVGDDVAAEGNFIVETHLDPTLQEVVEVTLQRFLRANSTSGINQGAVVVLDSRTGGILSLVGGRDYSTSQYNRASQALRQPGSVFKLFPYLVAIDRGVRPTTPVSASPIEWGGLRYSQGCRGSSSLKQAFASSDNCAALHLARRYSLDAVVRKARDFGITTPMAAVPGLVLGQSETLLLELTAAYAAVANGGIWTSPSTIRRLTDTETCPLDPSDCAQRSLASQRSRRVLPTDQALVMQTLLRSVIQSGTGRAAYLGGNEGGKTGTTNEGRDLTFIGYEPKRHWVMGVWLGNDDNSPTGQTSAAAAGLWWEIMRTAGQGTADAEGRP